MTIAPIEIIAHAEANVDTHVILSILTDSLMLFRTDLELGQLFLHLAIVNLFLPLPGYLQFLCSFLNGPLLVILLVL